MEQQAAAPPAAATVIAAKALVKRFGEREALKDVSLTASRGELVAVIGPNGAGKTTLLSILARIQNPDSGSIDWPSGETGWVPQQPALYGKLTVEENLSLFARLERVADVPAPWTGCSTSAGSLTAPATRWPSSQAATASG